MEWKLFIPKQKQNKKDALTFHFKVFPTSKRTFSFVFYSSSTSASFFLELNESCKQHVGREHHLLSLRVKTAGVRGEGEGESASIAV